MMHPIISKVADKIREDMKHVCTTDHDSILRDSNDAIKHFNWETVRLELVKRMPTLMSLLTPLVG